MRKRILFVDDEPLVLQGLQRTLRPMRQEWDMDFAAGGAQALAHFDDAHYDVVVSDMIMPGLDGAQLLKEIQARSPETIRLILSGNAEQQHAMKCVGVAHQYLSKPCDPETLRKTLMRVTAMGFARQKENIMQLLSRLERLPSIPTVYAEIVRLLKDSEVCMADVGAVIVKDIGITAHILKVVNSSFFGLPRRIAEPEEAAAYLGIETVKALVLATSVFHQFASTMSNGFSVDELSAHSQHVGATARRIAQTENAPSSVVNESLVAGFLHDTGKLVLAANLPKEFLQASILTIEQGMDPLEAERRIFGSTHADVGGYLLGLWGLPVPVVEAIALHHAPAESEAREFSPLTAVHVADALVQQRSHAASGDHPVSVDESYLTRLGCAERLPVWREAVEESFNIATT